MMLGAGVAERAGLFGTGMRAAARDKPKELLTPIVVLAGMLGNLAADAAYVVLIPLAGIVFHAAGRHPIAGIAAAFAGVSGGFSANLLPGQLDALLFGITEASVIAVFGDFSANIAGNWFFISVMTFLYLPIIWYVTDKIVEPRLGPWKGGATAGAQADDMSPDPAEESGALAAMGLRHAGYAALFVIALWLLMVFAPGTPLVDEAACEAVPAADCSIHTQLAPLYRSLVAAFFLLFLLLVELVEKSSH